MQNAIVEKLIQIDSYGVNFFIIAKIVNFCISFTISKYLVTNKII